MAGTFVSDTIQDGAGNTVPTTTAIKGSAKAWVTFNGTTSPGTIYASFNVSSVTKSTTGQYAVNFTNSMTDANYAITGSAGGTNPSYIFTTLNTTRYASYCYIAVLVPNVAYYDDTTISCVINR